MLPTPAAGKPIDLANVCSYPSAGQRRQQQPVRLHRQPGGGFLVIAKDAGTGVTTPAFGFTVTNPATTRSINGTGSAAPVAVVISANPSTSVTEATVTNWSLTSIQCLFENGTT